MDLALLEVLAVTTHLLVVALGPVLEDQNLPVPPLLDDPADDLSPGNIRSADPGAILAEHGDDLVELKDPKGVLLHCMGDYTRGDVSCQRSAVGRRISAAARP